LQGTVIPTAGDRKDKLLLAEYAGVRNIMEEKGCKNFIRKYLIRKNLSEVLVLLLCLAVLGGFVSRKEGYHMDELLSFELANAEFTPWIVPTQPVGRLEKFVLNEIRGESAGETWGNIAGTIKDVLVNGKNSRMLSYKADVYDEPVWMGRQQFIDYITVGKDDAFNYFSVYFNVKDDNHPPLHFMLLHTISSVFKGTISPAMGCVINLFAVAGIIILLMKLGKIYAQVLAMGYERAFGIMAAILYGLSAGAVATVLLIRMYALLTFFCVAYFYILVKKWRDDDFEGHNKLLIFVTVMGFLTQYFFLFYCLVLAFVTAVLLFGAKKYKALFSYIRSMIIAACLGLLCFPFAISDVFSSGRGVEALDNLAKGISGYGVRLAGFVRVVADRCGGYTSGVILILAVILFVAGIVSGRNIPEKRALPFLWMLFVPTVVYFLLASRMAPYMVDRYMMPLFPFLMFSFILIVFFICRRVGKCGVIIAFILVGLQVAGTVGYDGTYLYTGYSDQLAVAEQNADSACICVYAGVGYYENLMEFTDYDKTLLVTLAELEDRNDTGSITGLEDVVVIVKYGVLPEDVERIMTEKYGFERKEVLYNTREVTSDTVIRFVNMTLQ